MKNIKYPVLILIILLMHLAVNYLVLSNSRIIRFCDEGGRIFAGRNYYNKIFNSWDSNGFNQLGAFLSLENGQCHPHLYELVEAVSFKVVESLGFDQENVGLMLLIANGLFLLVLLWSIYGIGSILYDKSIGLSAALLTSVLPLAFGQSRNAMLDYPLLSLVSLSVYLLLKTKGFRVLLFCILSGFTMGLAQLTKESALVYILPPLLYYFYAYFKETKDRKVIFNFVVLLLTFMLVAGVVYFKPGNQHAFGIYLGKIFHIYQSFNPLYYFYSLKDVVGPIILVFSLPFLLSYLLHFNKREKLLFFWFFIPIILLSISPNKSPRFILPLAGAFSLIVIQEIPRINLIKTIKNDILAILILLSVLQYLLFNNGFFEKYRKDATFITGILSVYNDPFVADAEKLLDIINNDNEDEEFRTDTKILFLFFVPQFNFFFRGEGFNVSDILELDIIDSQVRNFDCNKAGEFILAKDYIILDKEPEYKAFVHQQESALCLRKAFLKHKDDFKMLEELKLSDGHIVCVYKRIDSD